MPSSRRTMFSHILYESLSEPEALHLACWQSAAFWLLQAQQETAGWWVPPLAISRLHLEEYMPLPASSNFWIMRQQKTMALAGVLQACAKESGSPIGVLCDVVWELQWCMVPQLILIGNKIVETSLLRPIEGEHGTSLTQKKKPLFWVTLNQKLNTKLNCPRFQNSWRSVSRYRLHSELPLLQLHSCPILPNEGTFSPEDK